MSRPILPLRMPVLALYCINKPALWLGPALYGACCWTGAAYQRSLRKGIAFQARYSSELVGYTPFR